MCIDIVLADPYPVMLEGLTHVFENSPEFSVKSCVRTGDAALQALEHHRPHILVMDLSLNQRSGLALLEDIKAKNLATRPVVFTGAPIGEVMRALDLDVPGLVSKEKSKQVLTRCIKSVHEGGKWLDRDLTVKTMSLLLEQLHCDLVHFVDDPFVLAQSPKSHHSTCDHGRRARLKAPTE